MSYLWLIYKHSVTDNIIEHSVVFLNVIANTFILRFDVVTGVLIKIQAF
jgi:hypothetical protein